MYSYFSTVILVGLVISLLCSEITGISPGGMIVPGYICLYLENIEAVGIILISSILTYFIVVRIFPYFLIIYGKRKFVAMLVVAIGIKFLIDFIIFKGINLINYQSTIVISDIGVIVPGLIANNAQKQGWLYTSILLSITTILTFSITKLIY